MNDVIADHTKGDSVKGVRGVCDMTLCTHFPCKHVASFERRH